MFKRLFQSNSSPGKSSRRRSRRLRLDALEQRRLLAADVGASAEADSSDISTEGACVAEHGFFLESTSPWQNSINRNDVNADARISPLDVLLVINQLADSEADMPSMFGRDGMFPDVTGDKQISPADILNVINTLASQETEIMPSDIVQPQEDDHVNSVGNQATVIDLGQGYGVTEGHLQSEDVDVFTVTGAASGPLLVSVMGVQATMNLEVVDAEGNTLAADTSSNTSDSESSIPMAFVDLEVEDGATYYIRVSSPSADSGDTVFYTVDVFQYVELIDGVTAGELPDGAQATQSENTQTESNENQQSDVSTDSAVNDDNHFAKTTRFELAGTDKPDEPIDDLGGEYSTGGFLELAPNGTGSLLFGGDIVSSVTSYSLVTQTQPNGEVSTRLTVTTDLEQTFEFEIIAADNVAIDSFGRHWTEVTVGEEVTESQGTESQDAGKQDENKQDENTPTESNENQQSDASSDSAVNEDGHFVKATKFELAGPNKPDEPIDDLGGEYFNGGFLELSPNGTGSLLFGGDIVSSVTSYSVVTQTQPNGEVGTQLTVTTDLEETFVFELIAADNVAIDSFGRQWIEVATDTDPAGASNDDVKWADAVDQLFPLID